MNTKQIGHPWGAKDSRTYANTEGKPHTVDIVSDFGRGGGVVVAECSGHDKERHAAFIIRACNAHDDLVAALESCLTSEGAACFGDMKNHPEWMQRRLYAISDIARAALAKAKR